MTLNPPSQQPEEPSATNIFAGAIQELQQDRKYSKIIGSLASLSQLLLKIDSQVPGAAEALLTEITHQCSLIPH